jgi:hypothetical protein
VIVGSDITFDKGQVDLDTLPFPLPTRRNKLGDCG